MIVFICSRKFLSMFTLIILDDLNVAPDFYEYFLGTHELLKNDSSLWLEYFPLSDNIQEIVSLEILFSGVCPPGTTMEKLATLTKPLPICCIELISSQDWVGCWRRNCGVNYRWNGRKRKCWCILDEKRFACGGSKE